MTLNITVLTEKTIYQSADFRLTDIRTQQPISSPSTKLVTLQYGGWHGSVSYTGMGQWEKRDTSEYILEWLTGLNNATFDDIANQIRDRGTEWLRKIEVASRRSPHTFILVGFEADQPRLALISNFEDLRDRDDLAKPDPSLTIWPWQLGIHSPVVVTGRKRAVSRSDRLRINHLIREAPDDPARIRRLLAEVNANAKESPEGQNSISRECSVVSFRVDGQGVCDIQGRVEIRSLIFGIPFPDAQARTKLLGPERGHVVGVTYASSKPRVPFGPCQPHIVIPDRDSGYTLREADHETFSSCTAIDVSNTGVVIGSGSPPHRPGISVMWKSGVESDLKLCDFIGRPLGINDAGDIVGQGTMIDGSEHAVLWRREDFIDLGCFRGRDSGAAAINAAGLIVGWVGIDSVNRGQDNYRPAAWSSGMIYVRENFGCDWGQAVDVNDTGTVLVVGYIGRRCRAILWNLLADTTEVIGGMEGIYPLVITREGIVLGTSPDRNGKHVSWLVKPGSRWEPIGLGPGFCASSMNNVGDIVGAVVQDGYEKPWLRRASGEIVWLPYFDQHWCRPSAINDAGTIVGTAQTDHGTHALIWTP